MTTANAAAGGWLFGGEERRPVTRQELASAGLPCEPLAAARVRLARAGRGRKWHQEPAGPGPQARCPRLPAGQDGGGQPLTVREASILDNDVCRACASRLVLPGPADGYLRLARLIIAAASWVDALEAAALSADWLACSRWTARTPFTDPRPAAALIAALADDPQWAGCAAAARAAWDQLRLRAEAGRERARHAAGSPGYRAVAAAAQCMVTASPATRTTSHFLAAIAGQAHGYDDAVRPWTIASHAWLTAVARDGDPAAGRHALRDTLLDAYADAPVRDLALLPAMPADPAEDYRTPADWAQADYRAALHAVATSWSDRLDAELAVLLDQPTDGWQLLLVLGWPLTDDTDRDLAYLASYPEHARVRDPHCGRACGRPHDSWAVVLHVPAFAARHAKAHDSDHLDAIAGPDLPPGATPTPDQIRALLPLARHADQTMANDLGEAAPLS